MAAILCGLVIAGLFTLAEVMIGTVLLHKRLGSMILLIPLQEENGEKQLREAVFWLEGQRGIFPGRVIAVDLGLAEPHRTACRQFCRGSGVEWMPFSTAEELGLFIANAARMDYT